MNDLEIISVLTGKEIVKHHVVREQIFIPAQNQTSLSPKVAFGQSGSFSSQVARKIFPDSSDYINCNSFRQIFEEVVSRNASYGVLPIENTITGSIHGIMNFFSITLMYLLSEKESLEFHSISQFSLEQLEKISRYFLPIPRGLLKVADF